MDVIARNVLLGSVVASSLGAIVMCILVFRYSFAPPSDEPSQARHQRIFVTRLGHAFASVCFATTAVLAIVGLALQPATNAERAQASDLHALTTRVGRVETIVRETSTAVTKMLDRVGGLERRRASQWSP